MLSNLRCLCVVVLLSYAGVAQANLLKNASFETGETEETEGWEFFGSSWRVSGWSNADSKDFHDGNYGAVNDTHLEGGDEWRGVSQTVEARQGRKYTATVWIRAFQVESTESYLAIQFLNEAEEVLEQVKSDNVVADQDFTKVTIEKVKAPDGTVAARIQGVVHMVSDPTESLDYHIFDEFAFDTAQKMKGQ